MRLESVCSAEAIERCARLAKTIWREFYTPIIGAEQVAYMLQQFQSAEAIRRQIELEGYRYRLLYEDNLPCGYCSTVPEADALKVSKLYLLRQRRGRGGGCFMLETCETEARRRGFSALLLTVNRHNPSLGFYKAYGFRIDREHIEDIGNGFVMDDFVLVKPLLK